jgi:hypothetical protein
MSTLSTSLKVPGLDRRQFADLKKKARKLGTTPEAYVRKLIADDLELDHMAATKTLSELAAPIREAFKETSEEEIGRLVESSRTRQSRRLTKR